MLYLNSLSCVIDEAFFDVITPGFTPDVASGVASGIASDVTSDITGITTKGAGGSKSVVDCNKCKKAW